MRNIVHTLLLALTLMLMLIAPVRAQDEGDIAATPEDLNFVDAGTVKEILKTDMIMLDNNRRYRLDNILVPPYEDGPAIEAMKKAFLNKKVNIYASRDVEENPDRYGLPLVHVVTADDNIWVQQYLVAKGLAWAYCPESSSSMVEILKQVEEKARAQKVGFWRNPVYAVKTAFNVQDYMNTYQIVEGKILSTYTSSHYIYFNFGKDWKTDFTIKTTISFSGWYAYGNDKESADPHNWVGRTIRIRGWVFSQDGPMIDLTNKEQIDVISRNG